MNIQLATSSTDLGRCYPVMAQLRPHLSKEEFVKQVERQQQIDYHLAYLESGQVVQAIAGFCIRESLAWSKHLYIDDLVTDEASRSKGYGNLLLSWLIDYAKQNDCLQLHLDSGVTRSAAHKFYLNQGFIIGGYHFAKELK